MNDLTYVEPPGLPGHLYQGMVVEVCDRTGAVLSEQKVTKITARTLTTECGRKWDRRGWWRGDEGRTWPFPFIRGRSE